MCICVHICIVLYTQPSCVSVEISPLNARVGRYHRIARVETNSIKNFFNFHFTLTERERERESTGFCGSSLLVPIEFCERISERKPAAMCGSLSVDPQENSKPN